MTVEPPTVHLQLVFDPSTLTVVAGSEETVMLSLLGVPVGAAVLVGFQLETVLVELNPEPVLFDAATTSREVTVMIVGVVEGSVTVPVTALELELRGLSADSSVASTELSVTVVPAPVDLALAFDPMTLTVTAGNLETATLRLPDVPDGAMVTVTLSSADAATAQVGSLSRSVVFTAAVTSHDVTIEGVVAGSVAVTAVADISGLPDGSTVVDAQLQVTVVPAPLQVTAQFDPPSLEVEVGSEMTVTLHLFGVPAGDVATADLYVAGGSGEVQLTPQLVVFDADTQRSSVVTVTGVSPGDAQVGVLFLVVGEQSQFLVPGQLNVTVVPMPVHLVLAFEPTTLTVVAGREETVRLRLLGDVPGRVAGRLVFIAVGIGATSEDVEVTPQSVTLSAGRVSLDVMIRGVAEGSATVTAAPGGSGLRDLPAGSTVAPADLAVTVVPPALAPIDLQLAFESSALTVAVGATATAVLSLSDELPEGVAVTVALSVADEAAASVMPDEVEFTSAATSREVTVEGVTEGSATLTADLIADSGLPQDSTVRSTVLEVTVVPAPVHLALAFDPPSLTVVVGSSETATLRLPGIPEGAAVTVALSKTDAVTVQVDGSLIFVDEGAQVGRDVNVTGVVEGSATVTAVAVEFADLPPGSSVALAQLPVTVVPPPVMLALAFDPTSLTVVVGSSETATLRLPGIPEGAAVPVALSKTDAVTVQVDGSLIFVDEGAQVGRDANVTVTGVVAGSATVTAVAVELADLPPGSSVALAQLPVTVVPPPVHLALAFDPTSLTVVAGSSATVMLSLPGIPEGAAVPVALSKTDAVTVQVDGSLIFVDEGAQVGRDVNVTVTGVAAGSATVTAVAVELADLPPGSIVASAQLPVTVVPAPEPVELQLAFAPPTLTVAAGATATAALSLPDVPMGVSVEVSLSTASTLVQVTPSSVTFTAQTPSTDVTVLGLVAAPRRAVITAAVDEEALADSGLPSGSSVELAELLVRIVPAPVHLQLAFDPPALTVVAGATTTVELSLLDVPLGVVLGVDVGLSAASTAVQVPPVFLVFNEVTTSLPVQVTGVAAGSAVVTAEVNEASLLVAGLPPDSSVEPAELLVTVVPAPVHLRLAFEPPELAVVVGSERTATLRLLGDVPADARVRAGVGVEVGTTFFDFPLGLVVVRVGPESVVSDVLLDAASPSFVMTVRGVAVGSTTVRVFVMDTDNLPPDSTVEDDAQLQVTVVPVPPEPVMLQLAFDPSSLTVAVGATATAVLSLSDELPEGVVVTVALSVADEATASVMPDEVEFTSAATSREVTVEGVTEGSATLTADLIAGSDLPQDSTVRSTVLEVTVVPPPVHLALAFDPPALTVVVGSSETATLSLPGIPEGAAVTVALSKTDAVTVQVDGSLIFVDEGAQVGRDVNVTGVVEGSATLTAVAVEFADLPPGSSVALAQLPVTVVPPPVMLALAFDPTSLTVVVGSEETAVLSLSGVPAGATVTVTLSASDEAAQVTPQSVTFTAQTPSTDVTVLGVAAGSAMVTAVADISDLPPDSTVASADLVVTVVPAPVMLQLAFAPPAVTVATGSEETAVLSLSGVPEGAEVTVLLSVADAATARLVTETELRFSATTLSHVVTVTGVAEGSVTVMAVEDVSLGLPEGSTVASADLAVTVEPAPVALQLAFAPSALTVAVGSEETAVLSLSGVPAGAEVTVTLSVADATTARLVTEPELRFSATTPSHVVTVEGVAEGSVTVMAVEDVLSGLPAGSSVASADLAVTVVPAPVVPLPVELQLAFAPPTLTVAVGSEETATLSLPDVPAGAEVTVSLSVADAATARLVTEPELRFSATTPSHVVTIEGVAEGSVTVMAVEDVLSGLPAGSSVASADLVVTVVPAPVDLELAFEPPALEVVVGATATATLSLLDVPAGAEVTVTLSVPDETTARLVTESELRFSATTPSHVVTIEGVAEGSVAVMAVEDVLSGLPEGSTVAPADLAVTVVPAPVHLQLAFAPMALTVTAGATADGGVESFGCAGGR